MPIYTFECTSCRRPRKNILYKGIVRTKECVKMNKPCVCGNKRFEKMNNEPISRTPGNWR